MQVNVLGMCMISVAYINDNHALLEYGRQYLEYRGGCLVETIDSLKHIPDWIPFHTYDVIISREYINGISALKRILPALPYDDTTPIIILLDGYPLKIPENKSHHQPMFVLRISQDRPAFFFEMNQLIKLTVCRQKATDNIKSLDILLKRSEISLESTVEDNIKAIVETCGRSLQALFTAYYRTSDRTQPPVAVWHAGEFPLYYILDDQVWDEARPRQIRKCSVSPGWTGLPDGRIVRTGKEGMFAVVMFPVTGQEWQEGVLCNVFPSNHVLTDYEFLMLETFSDIITWNERMASRYPEEVNVL